MMQAQVLPTMAMYRTVVNGKRAVQVVIRNPNQCPVARQLVDTLGMSLKVDMANWWEIITADAAQLTTIQSALKSLFAADGSYIGPR